MTEIFRYGERVSFLSVFDELLLGETISLKVFRDAKVLDIDLSISPFNYSSEYLGGKRVYQASSLPGLWRPGILSRF